MAGTGGRKFETMEFPDLNVSIQTFITKEGRFIATFANTRFVEHTYDELKKKLYAAALDRANLIWIPIMMIEVESAGKQMRNRGDLTNGLMVSATRQWVTKRPNGDWAYVGWNVAEDQRVNEAQNFRVYEYGRGFDVEKQFTPDQFPIVKRNFASYASKDEPPRSLEHWLPYDERLWEGIVLIMRQLETLRVKLDEIVGSAEGRDRIIERAVKFLPEGKP